MTTLRPETPEDALAVAGLHMRAWQVGYANILPLDFLDALDLADWEQRRMARHAAGGSPFTDLVAEQEGKVVGWVCFGPYRIGRDRENLDPAVGEILACYVDPDVWGTGVVDQLIERALDGLTQAEVRLWVFEDNERARRAYARYGLLPDGDRTLFRLEGFDADFAMIRLTLRRER